MPPLFYKFFRNIADCFIGRRLWSHLLAMVLTYVIVMSGFDWFYFKSLDNTPIFNFFFPAVFIGMFVPILLPLTMLAVGAVRKNARMINAAWGIGQAAIIGLLVSWFYKVFTGRIQPPLFANNAVDASHGFRLGILRGGIFWGWPSSHTTVAFAVAIALWTLYSDRPWVKYPGLIYALYVGIGVSMSIHWFSDAVAGAIFGTIIGIVVGTSFRNRINGKIDI